MSKSQSSNVDCRCDGDEMSNRDQKGRTRPLDRVKEDVSQEYFTCRNKLIYTWHIVSGKRWVGWVRWIIQQAFRWVDRSLKSKIHHVTHKQKMIMKYLEELLTLVALIAWFTYGYLVLIAVV